MRFGNRRAQSAGGQGGIEELLRCLLSLRSTELSEDRANVARVDISKRGPPTKWRAAAISIELLLIEQNSRYYEERLLFGAEKPVSGRQMLKLMSEQTV